MKNQPPGMRYALLVIGLAFLAMLVMDFNSRMAELRRLTAERDQVQQELGALLGTNAALKTQIAYATSDAAVVQWAYQDGNMVRPGDVPVVPLPASSPTPAPTPTPRIEATQVSNLEQWWVLFFGPKNALP